MDNVSSFLGLPGYYQSFIHNFAGKTAPLTRLLGKESTLHWGATQEDSFQELKSEGPGDLLKDPRGGSQGLQQPSRSLYTSPGVFASVWQISTA